MGRQAQEIAEFLREHEPGDALKSFADDCRTLRELWQKCPRGDWMIWLLHQLGAREVAELRLFACWCARRYWHLMTDQRSRTAVDAAERFALAGCTWQELRSTREDAAEVFGMASRSGTACAGSSIAKLAWAATLDCPLEAASQASLYAAAVARSTAVGPMHEALAEALSRQAVKLRELIPDPFVFMESDAAEPDAAKGDFFAEPSIA